MAEPIIFDTDIGTDIDDAYALSLILKCPELDLQGVTIGHGPTFDRARIAMKLLHCAAANRVQVHVGRETVEEDVNQAPWGEDFDLFEPQTKPAAEYIVESLRDRPGAITLICVGPFTNPGDAVELDPEVMKLAKRIVIMGGCIGLDAGATPQAYPEHNVKSDIQAAQKFFASADNITLVPLDVTRQVELSESMRQDLAESDLALPTALTELYPYWPGDTPTMHDPLAVGVACSPRFCGTRIMSIKVDDEGNTIVADDGNPMQVCTSVQAEEFMDLYMKRLLAR